VADVQLENGHIRIANNLFRALSCAKLTDTQRRIMLEATSRQFGWSNPSQPPRPWSAGGTDMSRSVGCGRTTAAEVLGQLVELRMLVRVAPQTYLLVKDFDRWRCGFHVDPDRVHWTPKEGHRRVSPLQNSVPASGQGVSSGEDSGCPEPRTLNTPQTRTTTASPASLEPLENQRRERENARTRDRRWSVYDLRSHLGDSRMTPPAIQAPQWVGIIEKNTDEQIDATLKLCAKKDRPLSYFLALHDEEGRRLDDDGTKQKKRPGASRRRPRGHVRS